MIKGNRHDLSEEYIALEQGEFGKGIDGLWYFRVPESGFGVGCLAKHTVTENADGTITVSPSILCTGHFNKKWHGYLENGFWRKI